MVRERERERFFPLASRWGWVFLVNKAHQLCSKNMEKNRQNVQLNIQKVSREKKEKKHFAHVIFYCNSTNAKIRHFCGNAWVMFP